MKRFLQSHSISFFMSLLSLGTLVAVGALVDPDEKSVAYVLIPPALVWLSTFFGALSIAHYLVEDKKRRRHIAAVVFLTVTFAVVLLLLNAIDQLTVRDAVLSCLFVGVCFFYFSRAWSKG